MYTTVVCHKQQMALLPYINKLQLIINGLMSLSVSVIPDLVGGHEEEHRGVEAAAHFLLPGPLLHQPHLLQVRYRRLMIFCLNCDFLFLKIIFLHFMMYSSL